MRWTDFVEALLFSIGFLVVCLVILTGRSAQPVPVRKTVSTSSRRGIAG